MALTAVELKAKVDHHLSRAKAVPALRDKVRHYEQAEFWRGEYELQLFQDAGRDMEDPVACDTCRYVLEYCQAFFSTTGTFCSEQCCDAHT